MERHLEEGCYECRKLVLMWKEVLEIGRCEPSYNPPVYAVRSAKAGFVPDRSWKWLGQIAQVAQLIFDGSRAPASAAVRGAVTSSPQFLHEAKPFVIDLRMECLVGKAVRLTGQVLNSNEPDKEVPDVEVFLLKGEDLAFRTTANNSGEFELEFQDEEGLQLFIDIRGRKVVEIQLPPRSRSAST